MNQVKSLVNPLCSMVQSNKKMLSMVLVLLVVVTYLPIDELLRTNLQSKFLGNFKVSMGMVTRIVASLLILCLYFNNDVMNLVLLLWFCKAMKL